MVSESGRAMWLMISMGISSGARISIVIKFAHGRCCEGNPTRFRMLLPTGARLLLKSFVSQISCSGASISNQLVQDLDHHGGGGHKKTHQSGRQTNLGKI